MTDNDNFNTKFWDTELGNFQSYEALLKRIKEEQRASRDYLEFMRLRVLAEESHGKAIAKLGKTSASKTEIGVLGGAWKNCHLLCSDWEAATSSAAAKLVGELEHAQELLGRQVEQRKKEDDEVREVQQSLKNAISKLQAKQRNHQSKSKELEKARQVMRDQFNSNNTKDASKAAGALAKAEQNWESACTSLNQAETQLEDARTTWEFKTEQALETFQALQEQRLNALANLQEVVVETMKEHANRNLTILERWVEFDGVSVEMEISSFIQRHGNNNERPSVIPLSNFDGTDKSVNTPRMSSHSTHSSATSPEGPALAEKAMSKIKRMLPTPTKPPRGSPQPPAPPPAEHAPAPPPAPRLPSLTVPPSPPAPTPAKRSNDEPDNEPVVYAELRWQNRKEATPPQPKEAEPSASEVVYAAVTKQLKKKLPKLPSFKKSAKDKPKSKSGGYSFGDGAEAAEDDFSDDDDDEQADDEDEADMYGEVGTFSTGSQLMRVIYTYKSKHSTDISLAEGDLVRVVQEVSDEWVEVKSHHGTVGHFPKNYLEPADS